jgi:hypothetical protein
MKTKKATEKHLTFRVLGREPVSGRVKDPQATLGEVSQHVAARLGIAGAFECLDSKNRELSPETRLADLPEEEITLATELTPAWWTAA